MKLTLRYSLVRFARKRKRDPAKIHPEQVCSETLGDQDPEEAKQNYVRCVRNILKRSDGKEFKPKK